MCEPLPSSASGQNYQKAIRIALSFLESIHCGDMERLASLLAEDGLVEIMTEYQRFEAGPAGFQAIIAFFGTRWQDTSLSIGSVIHDGDAVACEFTIKETGDRNPCQQQALLMSTIIADQLHKVLIYLGPLNPVSEAA